MISKRSTGPDNRLHYPASQTSRTIHFHFSFPRGWICTLSDFHNMLYNNDSYPLGSVSEYSALQEHCGNQIFNTKRLN